MLEACHVCAIAQIRKYHRASHGKFEFRMERELSVSGFPHTRGSVHAISAGLFLTHSRIGVAAEFAIVEDPLYGERSVGSAADRDLL